MTLTGAADRQRDGKRGRQLTDPVPAPPSRSDANPPPASNRPPRKAPLSRVSVIVVILSEVERPPISRRHPAPRSTPASPNSPPYHPTKRDLPHSAPPRGSPESRQRVCCPPETPNTRT